MNENRSCPTCEQLVMREAQQLVIKGRVYHIGCCKEIAEAYLNTLYKQNNNSIKGKKFTVGVRED